MDETHDNPNPRHDPRGTGETGRPHAADPAAAAALEHALEVFHGQATAAEARFYAHLPSAVAGSQLAGEVVGPFSHRTRCLPATVKFRPLPGAASPAASPLAAASPSAAQAQVLEAVVPDPCFWQPEEPYYYEVCIRLQQAGQTLAQVKRTVGLRPLGAHGRRFYLQGKPWVVRGVTPPGSLRDEDWHDAVVLGAALAITRPDATICQQAHRHGVLLMAEVARPADIQPGEPSTPSAEDVAAIARQLALQPSVGFLLLDARTPWSQACQAATRNLLVGCRLDPARQAGQAIAGEVPNWAQFVALRWPEHLTAQSYAELAAQIALPVCAEQTSLGFDTLAAGRAACDALQRRLAGLGEFAGYLVSDAT